MSKEKRLKEINKKLELLRNETVIELMKQANSGATLFHIFKTYESEKIALEKQLGVNAPVQLDLEQAIKNEKDENWRL